MFISTPFPSKWADGAMLCSSTALTCEQHPETTNCNKPSTHGDARGSLLSRAIPLHAKCLLPQKSLVAIITCRQIIATQVQPPSLPVHTPAAWGGRGQVPGLRNSPERRQTSRVKEAVLRELWESLHHILPLTIELYPPSKARPSFPGLPVPKTLTLEAGALFKQALWALGVGIGVPQLC